MSHPLISILMAGLSSRPWQRMQDTVLQQAEPFGDMVEFVPLIDGGEATSGQKRQQLADSSHGEYLCFVDDDDQIADTYVADVLKGCRSGADVVTFQLEMRRNRIYPELWTFGLMPNMRRLGRMCVNHLCAWRREIATRVAWCPDLGYADDQLWFLPLFHAGLISTQYHIEKPLYHYVFDSGVTQNQTRDRIDATRHYVGGGLRCYRDPDGELFIEVGGPRQGIRRPIFVRDRRNNVQPHDPDRMVCYHTLRIQ